MSLASATECSPELSSAEPRHASVGAWGIVEWMALSQTLLPAILLIPGAQGVRVPIRVAAYGVSLAALVLFWGRRRGSHPSEPVLCLVIGLLAIMIFHPTTNSPLAGLAQTMLYVSVMAPLFWVPALVGGSEHLRRVLWILLVANGLNSFVGVMQVYDPDRWMPPEFSDVVLGGAHGLDRVSYTGPDGALIIRPPGLTDNPGAVAGPGAIAAVLGFVLFMRSRTLLAYLTTAACGILGVAAILLTHVRTSLLVALGSMTVYLTLLVIRREYARALSAVLLISVGVAAAFSLGIVLGGESTSERYETLVEDDPLTVYYEARGLQMQHAVVELSREYPLGAGLARWGMMRRYFGDPTNLNSPPIWSEIQVSSWLLDGGIALIVLYGLALAIAAAWELKYTVESRVPAAREWGPVVVALNAGTLALVLSYTPFTSPIGMQYWFLAGCFYGACRSEENGVLS